MKLLFICGTVPDTEPTGRKWTYEELVTKGHRIENGKISDVELVINPRDMS